MSRMAGKMKAEATAPDTMNLAEVAQLPAPDPSPEGSPASDPTPSPDPSPAPDPKPAADPAGPAPVPGVIPPKPPPSGCTRREYPTVGAGASVVSLWVRLPRVTLSAARCSSG
jgi:hypothetical protein